MAVILNPEGQSFDPTVYPPDVAEFRTAVFTGGLAVGALVLGGVGLLAGRPRIAWGGGLVALASWAWLARQARPA